MKDLLNKDTNWWLLWGILDIEEYERLQDTYDLLEQKEIEMILLNRTNEDKEVSRTKKVSIEF